MVDSKITIDSDTYNQVSATLFEKGIENLSKEDLDFIIKLKINTQTFLQKTEKLSQEIAQFQTLLKEQSRVRKSFRGTGDEKGYLSVDSYVENRNMINIFLKSGAPAQLYQAVFDFQNQLNEALGQKVEMIYVHETTTGEPILYSMGSESLKFDYSSTNKLTARYKMNQKDIQNSLMRLQADNADDLAVKNVKATYGETMSRYRNSKIKTIFWLNQNPPSKWKKMKISATGDINEAYAGIILGHQAKLFKGSIEPDIDTFAPFIANVDNISGLLQGDIESEDGSIQYAVKSFNASTLGLKQIQALAKEIISSKSLFDKQKLLSKKEEFARKGRTRNFIKDALEKEINDSFKDIKI